MLELLLLVVSVSMNLGLLFMLQHEKTNPRTVEVEVVRIVQAPPIFLNQGRLVTGPQERPAGFV